MKGTGKSFPGRWPRLPPPTPSPCKNRPGEETTAESLVEVDVGAESC